VYHAVEKQRRQNIMMSYKDTMLVEQRQQEMQRCAEHYRLVQEAQKSTRQNTHTWLTSATRAIQDVANSLRHAQKTAVAPKLQTQE
jgi:hypothetical protein